MQIKFSDLTEEARAAFATFEAELRADRARIRDSQAKAAGSRKAYRTFVCQGCGKVADVLHGKSIICGCGATSAAEILT